MSSLSGRLASVRQSIQSECLRLGRAEPTLIVVTKNHPIDLVDELYSLGERDFGENRVQEAVAKFSGRGDWGASLHLIGQLQTNKVRQALEIARVIHSLDRDSLLVELIKRTAERPEPLEVFIQVNLTTDEDRGGVMPSELEAFADRVSEVNSLSLMGLMAVATLEDQPERDFEIVAELGQRLRNNHPNAKSLSIGMSGDYLTALGYGATHLRIGTAITGKRQY